MVYGEPVNQLISVIGASGVGKTSLVRALTKTHKFATALESHDDRPFQALFKEDKRYGLVNQIDYFLLRAEQERELRAASQIGLMDGGLDLDFYTFTRLFLSRNLLTGSEYDLCQRAYAFIRAYLPPPELFVRLVADEATITSRLTTRERINIARAQDTALFNSFLDEWLATLPSGQVLEMDVSHEMLEYQESKRAILERLLTL